MSDTSIAIKIAGEDAQHHAAAIRLTSDDEAWVKELSDSAKPVRIRIPDDADTEGHELSAAVTVVVDTDDDDTEGHALSLHFPSVKDANDFRRRMLAAGLITATIAVGAAQSESLTVNDLPGVASAPTAVRATSTVILPGARSSP